MKIRVCIPFYMGFELVKPSLRALVFKGDHEFSFEARQSSVPRWARNAAINDEKSKKKKQKILTETDYHLIVDSDIGFCPETVNDLIKRDVDVCCAPYVLHDDPSTYECGTFGDTPGIIGERFKIYEKGFKKIDWTGAGLMLFKSKVFEKFEFPWFRQVLVSPDGENQDESSEDVGLCLNLKNHGIDLWCDFDIKIAHFPRRNGPVDFSLWSDMDEKEIEQYKEFQKREKDGASG